MSDPRAAAHAVDALRRGWEVRIAGARGTLALLAIETADMVRLAAFDPAGNADILLSTSRAATLKLANQRDAVAGATTRIARAPWIDMAMATAIADPALDLATPFKGPFRAVPVGARDAAAAAMELARLAGLLPAFFAYDAPDDVGAITPDDIAAYDSSDRLVVAARARLPVEASEGAEIVAFRTAETADEHVALIIGTPDGSPPLVRLHSECLTGDVLGSLKCDCGPQLHAALHAIADTQWGILLYLRQEGRGIGLINKLRAYSLQDQGFDTVDANTRLGFAVDVRDFSVAARMLDLLGVEAVRLLTNNPDKVAGLESHGVKVVERVPHKLPANKYNEKYLATKRDRTGHQL